jgi:hypothetical protein
VTRLRRRHYLEIHDQPWCPPAVRDGATDCLRLIAVVGRQFNGAVASLEEALAATGDRYVVDLGSGSGGPWLSLYDKVAPANGLPIVVLTDLFPNLTAMIQANHRSRGRIQFVPGPVSAMAVPPTLPGLRTLFTAFHHFKPSEASAILQDAADAGQAIAIYEQTRRTIWALLFMVVLAPLAFLGVPLIRPFRWSRLFWTYVIPAIPLVLLHDGIVSCLRTYTESELKVMTEQLEGPEYVWRIGRKRTLLSPLGISYLVGYPVTAVDAGGSTVPRVARTK